MKSKFLIIPGENEIEKVDGVDFLFPLEKFSIGQTRTFAIDEIVPGSYIYINRLLDTQDISELRILYPKILEKAKGVVFEDLGVLELFREFETPLEMCLYATHALCSSYTVKAFLDEVDTVILSNDLTKEEVLQIISLVPERVGLLLYGHLPYMYSRRTLLKNFALHYELPIKNRRILKEKQSGKEFLAIETDEGTVLYDSKVYDGRIFLEQNEVKYFLIDLSFTKISSIKVWLEAFLNGEKLTDTTSGFLYQKTIYRLPPKGGKKDD